MHDAYLQIVHCVLCTALITYLIHFLTTKNASSTILDVNEPSSRVSMLTAYKSKKKGRSLKTPASNIYQMLSSQAFIHE